MSPDLLSEINAFQAAHKLGDYSFGLKSVNNGRLVQRLRAGGRVWPEQEQRIRDFIRTYQPKIRRRSQRQTEAA